MKQRIVYKADLDLEYKLKVPRDFATKSFPTFT